MLESVYHEVTETGNLFLCFTIENLKHFLHFFFNFSVMKLLMVKKKLLTGESACPLDLPVDEKVVEDESTEDEDETVQVLHGWFVDDGSEN